jgi:hypothetical protein
VLEIKFHAPTIPFVDVKGILIAVPWHTGEIALKSGKISLETVIVPDKLGAPQVFPVAVSE